jgi:hypothetical protein
MAFGAFAGVLAALAFRLTPAQAPLLAGLLVGGLLGVPLAHAPSGRFRWSSILGAAALGLCGMFLTGGPAGAFRFWGLPAWVAAPLGGSVFAFLLAWGSGLGRLRLGDEPAALPTEPRTLPAAVPESLRVFADQAFAVRDRIRGLLLEQSGDPGLVGRIRKTGDDLASKVVDQIRRWHEVERCIDPGAVERLSTRVEDLQRRIEQTEDATAKQGFEAARDALIAQLGLYKRLGVGRERLNARLHQHLATLEKLHLTLVNLKSADAQRFSVEVNPMLEEVGDLSQEVDILTEVSDALTALSRP